MTGLVQPLACPTTLLPALHNESLPSWEDTIDVNKALSLSSSGLGGFHWPQEASIATPVTSTPDLSPALFTQPFTRDTSTSTQLQRNTTSTESIPTNFPQTLQHSTMSYIPDIQQPPTKRARTIASAKQPSPNVEETNTLTRPKRSTTQSTRRKKSVSTAPSEDPEPDSSEEQEKLRIYRERNRIAAAKTRRKKKSSAKELEQRAQEVLHQNEALKQEERQLRDALSTLRFTALAHDPSTGCGCTDIHVYNQRRALEMAQEMAASTTTGTGTGVDLSLGSSNLHVGR
ncbi:Basic leucine zipper (bZIP) transcription factor atfB [Pseudocercospora fuligena]|uniref:Basic leucine zipper (BZIP) transcription factor atfB n=1 Tax=Pseudocercospora fuligena TaxID=685502 RepID=A0A8H6RIL9_9PEZI|nr:Basic leucine zipper (bZIP) transcription factor atfB [Pseudocercospora fuligena]